MEVSDKHKAGKQQRLKKEEIIENDKAFSLSEFVRNC